MKPFFLCLLVVASSLLAAGCALSPAKVAEIRQSPHIVQLGQDTKTRMNIVTPHVTAQHLNECKTRLERQGFLGSQYKVSGTPRPSVIYSCATATRGALGLGALKNTAAYAVPIHKVKGVYGTGNKNYSAACVFTMSKGQVSLSRVFREVKARNGSQCHFL